jgi:hypothetical protein
LHLNTLTFLQTNHRQLSRKLLLWFSLHFSLLLPHNHFGVLEVYFSLQIRLVSNLDAWSDFLDIPKKAFNSLPLYRVQKLKRYSWNVKLSKEYLMNHLTPLSYYLISLLVHLLYGVGSTTCIYFIIYCITTKLVWPPVSILSFIALLRSWFDHLYLFYHLLHYYRVGLTTCIYFIIYCIPTKWLYRWYPYPMHHNVILLGFIFKCSVTKSIMLRFGA